MSDQPRTLAVLACVVAHLPVRELRPVAPTARTESYRYAIQRVQGTRGSGTEAIAAHVVDADGQRWRVSVEPVARLRRVRRGVR
jgi:hypothetical protein